MVKMVDSAPYYDTLSTHTLGKMDAMIVIVLHEKLAKME